MSLHEVSEITVAVEVIRQQLDIDLIANAAIKIAGKKATDESSGRCALETHTGLEGHGRWPIRR